jgi:hypothetical protein
MVQSETTTKKKTPYYETELHNFLLPYFKKAGGGLVEGGRINTLRVAKLGDVARFTVYRWFESDHITKKAVKVFVELSQGPEKDKEGINPVDMARFLVN